MSKVLHGLPLKYVYWYIDDILIITPTFELHLEVLQLVFDRLCLFGMLLKPTKCLFIAAEMLYLGFIISSEGLKPEPAKLRMIADWPVPTKRSHVGSFLGFTGYYRRFVPGYSEKMVAMHKEKNSVEKTFNWTAECQKEFKLV